MEWGKKPRRKIKYCKDRQCKAESVKDRTKETCNVWLCSASVHMRCEVVQSYFENWHKKN